MNELEKHRLMHAMNEEFVSVAPKKDFYAVPRLFAKGKVRNHEEISCVMGLMIFREDTKFVVVVEDEAAYRAWLVYAEEQGAELEASVPEKCPATSSLLGSACVMATADVFPEFLQAAFYRKLETAAWPPPNVSFRLPGERGWSEACREG